MHYNLRHNVQEVLQFVTQEEKKVGNFVLDNRT